MGAMLKLQKRKATTDWTEIRKKTAKLFQKQQNRTTLGDSMQNVATSLVTHCNPFC